MCISDYLYIYIVRVPVFLIMPVINIYLPQELFELVKKDKSKIVQQALKEYVENQTKKMQTVSSQQAETYVG